MGEDKPFWEAPFPTPEGLTHPEQFAKTFPQILATMTAAFNVAIGDDTSATKEEARELHHRAIDAMIGVVAAVTDSWQALYEEKYGSDPRGE